MQAFDSCFQLYYLYFDSNLKGQLLHREPNLYTVVLIFARVKNRYVERT